MTLPPSYTTSAEYLKDALSFLKSYQWLYNINNTHILVYKIFSNFSVEWVQYFKNLSNDELNQLPVNKMKENCPLSLKQLLDKIQTLKPDETSYHPECVCKLSHNSGLSKKKLHEIVSLVPVIDRICKEYLTDLVIDVGAGLGYLSHILNDGYNYKVLGIECLAEYVNSAYKNQEKYYTQSKGKVVFAKHFIDAKSAEIIAELTKTHFDQMEPKSACIVGLHACADLSITILDIFSKLDIVKCLVVMPCCYHRIKLRGSEEDKEYFENFPSSTVLKDLFEAFEAENFLRTPFLRLACQHTLGSFINMSEEEHQRHSRNFMYRAILQDVVASENCRVKRLKRKSNRTRISDPDQDFTAYLDNLQNSHRLVQEDDLKMEVRVNDERFMRRMREKWNEQKGNCCLVEALTGLQAAIQSVCENVVLLDRVEFLREKGFHCRVEKVTNDTVSPRCHALIAVKR